MLRGGISTSSCRHSPCTSITRRVTSSCSRAMAAGPRPASRTSATHATAVSHGWNAARHPGRIAADARITVSSTSSGA